MSNLARSAVSPRFEWLWVSLAAPFLLFPTRSTPATLVALALFPLLWGLQRATGQRAKLRSPLLVPVLLLTVMAAIAFAISPARDLSWPKATGILLGVLCLRAVLAAVRTRPRLYLAIGLYLLIGTGFAATGLLGTSLNNKYLPAAVTSRFPQRFAGLPGTDGSVNPNALGATTLFCLPVALVLMTVPTRWWVRAKEAHDTAPVSHQSPASARPTPAEYAALGNTARTVVGMCLALLTSILVLSQSRTCWASMGITVGVLAALRWRRARWVAVGCVAAVLLAVLAGALRGAEPTGEPAPAPVHAAAASLSLEARVEIWSRAVYGVEDFPFTGMGLNAFRRVVHVLYPLTQVPLGLDIAHAHNVFLQTALDVGIPGLVAYVALILVASFLCWRRYRQGDREARLLAVGLFGNLLAVQLFGLTDAIVLGAKVGLFFWWNLGLIAALHDLAAREPGATARMTPDLASG